MKQVRTSEGKTARDHDGSGAGRQNGRSGNSEFPLQAAIGNRNFAGLFRETVGSRNDSFEREADQAARSLTSPGSARGFDLSSSPGGIQRKCAACEHEEEEKIRRAPKDDATPEKAAAAPEAAPAPAQEEAAAAQPEAEAAPSLLVEDSEVPGPGKMGKTQFLTALRAQVTVAADDTLAGTGQTSEGCPWIDYWLGYYADQSASHVEGALRKYAPEAAGAESASDYFAAVTARVRRSVLIWSKTGEVTGVPEDLPGAGAAAGAAGVLSAVGGMFFKARRGGPKNANPASVRDQLGSGRPLPGGVRSRMESAFGSSFGAVRMHTDGTAAQVSDQLNARAFTVGEHVAFGSGEYHPGTIAGDALMAHELAHVVQQGGAKQGGVMGKSPASAGPIEEDADRSAVGAVASLWGGVKGGLKNSGPSIRSGLQLSRCSKGSNEVLSVSVRPVRIANDDGTAKTALPSFDSAKSIWKKCCIDITVGGEATVNKTAYKTLDESLTDTPTAEESALFTDAGASGGSISVFIADQFAQGGTTGKDISGGAGTYDIGQAEPKVVAVEGIDSTVVAHEIGHAMGLPGAAHKHTGTVMQPSNAHNKKVPEAVNDETCSGVRSFTSATKTGRKDCSL